MKLTIERVDERTVRAYFDALDPLVRPETVLFDALVKENLAKVETDLQVWGGAG